MAEVRIPLEDADGNLPMVCASCGEPATVTKRKRLSWFPPWVHVLIITGILPYAIVASILTRRARVEIPFCERHKWHWLYRSAIIWGSLLCCAALGAGAMIVWSSLPRGRQDDSFPFVCMGCIVLLVGWLVIVCVAQGTAIRAKEITDDDVVVRGVSEEFVDAFEDVIAERKARRRRRRMHLEEDEDEEEEPRPRKKPPTDAIVEERRPRKRPPGDAIEE